MEGSKDDRRGADGKADKVDSASPCDHFPQDDELDGLPAAEQVKQILLHFVRAVNKREFDPGQLPWTRVAPGYTSALHNPNAPVEGVSGVIEQQKQTIAMAPNYALRALDLEVTYLNEQSGRATVFFNAETTGLYPNVTIHTTGIAEFRRVGSKWMASRFEGARGINDGGGTALF